MSQDIRLVTSYYEAINAARWDGYDAIFTPDAALAAPGDVTGTGPEAMQAFDRIWKEGFSDFTITPVHQLSDGGRVISENRVYGTHDGVLRLPTGALEPTGRKIDDRYVGVFEIADGRISAQRIYFDRMGVAERLGLLPAAVASGS
jgi:ketosteroid isomerase-like protein